MFFFPLTQILHDSLKKMNERVVNDLNNFSKNAVSVYFKLWFISSFFDIYMLTPSKIFQDMTHVQVSTSRRSTLALVQTETSEYILV